MTLDPYPIVRDRAVAEASELRQQVAELRAALVSLVDQPLRYNDARVEIDCASHADAMERVRVARAVLGRTK